MKTSTAIRLQNNIPLIMAHWEKRALVEIAASKHQDRLALRNSLPEYLTHLVDSINKNIDRTHARNRSDKLASTNIGKKHGSERADNPRYTMDQMILEYHILREVICDVLEDDYVLTPVEREVIVCSIEQAVNDAATEFSDTVKANQDQLAHTLVHDLRNPLMTARMSAEILLRNLADKTKCENKVYQILKSIDRIDKMIGDLLDAEKNKELVFTEMDLDQLTHSVIEESGVTHSGEFIFNSPGVCLGNWNEDSLRRLLENLITNAIKYGLKNSPITLSISQDAASATLSIHNQGPVIAPEEMAILFHKFRRAKSAENKMGWGLGLTVVQGIVDAHQGEITVVSNLDQGTTFTIKLPKDSSR